MPPDAVPLLTKEVAAMSAGQTVMKEQLAEVVSAGLFFGIRALL